MSARFECAKESAKRAIGGLADEKKKECIKIKMNKLWRY